MARMFTLQQASWLGILPPSRLTLTPIPGGDKGTEITLKRMRDIVWKSLRHPQHGPLIREMAIRVTNHCKTKDFNCELESLFLFVRDKIRWVKDTKAHETLVWPARTMMIGAGDCDDLSLVLVSLLLSIGHSAKFKAIAAIPDNPQTFSHVYVLGSSNGQKWIPMDPTVKNAAMGWESPVQFRSMILDLNRP